MDLDIDNEFVSREHRAIYATLSLAAAFVFAGAGYLFLSYGLSSGSELASVLSYVVAFVLDVNALAFLVSGVYNFYRALHG